VASGRRRSIPYPASNRSETTTRVRSRAVLLRTRHVRVPVGSRARLRHGWRFAHRRCRRGCFCLGGIGAIEPDPKAPSGVSKDFFCRLLGRRFRRSGLSMPRGLRRWGRRRGRRLVRYARRPCLSCRSRRRS